MNSFYGGQKGQSFELVKTYNSKSSMIADFGSIDCPVIFGQYVSISSSDEDRGKIYRRTQNLANGQNGAVLVGTIKGTDGQDAKLNITTFNSIPKVITYLPIETLININPAGAGYYELVNEEYILTQDTVPTPNKIYYEKITNEYILQEDLSDLANSSLISGELQKDSIKFRTKTVRENDIFETSVGVQVPYNVIKFNTGIDYDNNFSITPVEQKPFYQEYNLNIPQILNGDSLKQIKLITNSVEDKTNYPIIYDLDNPSQPLDRESIQSAICYKMEEHTLVTVYTPIENPTGNPKSQKWYIATSPNIYVLTEDEIVNNNRTYYEKTKTDNIIEKWYKLCDFVPPNLVYNSTDSSFHFTNDASTETIVPIKVIDNVALNQNGQIEVTYTTKNNNNEKEKDILTPALKWISRIELGNNDAAGTGTNEYYKVIYNDGTYDSIPTYTNSIANVLYNQENGVLSVVYSRAKILKKYNQILSGEEGQTPISLHLLELNPTTSQYQELIQSKLDNDEFADQEEYLQAVNNLIAEYEQTQDFLYQDTEDTDFVTYSNNIKKVYFYDSGQYKYFSNSQNVGTIKSIVSLQHDAENNRLIATYNTGEEQIVGDDIRGVVGIRYDNITNQLKISYTDGAEESLGLALKIVGADLNKYNQFVLKLNNGAEFVTSKSLNYPEDIIFNSTTQKLELRMSSQYEYVEVQEPTITEIKSYYEYNAVYDNYIQTADTIINPEKTYYKKNPIDEPTKEISPALNYIEDIQIDPETYNLLVLFSDPALKSNVTFNGIVGWRNLGCIKDNSGLWVTGRIEEATIYNPLYNTIEHTIQTLNSQYPQGYHNNIHECIAVGAKNESKKIYAYDDVHHTWYLLGNFNANVAIAANSVDEYDAGIAYNVEALPEGGLWFVTEGRYDDYDEDIEYFGTNWEYF